MIQITFSLLRLHRCCAACAQTLVCGGVLLYGLMSGGQAGAAWQARLSDAEQAEAVSVALNDADSGVQDNLAAAPRMALAETMQHPLGMQVLMAELREFKNSVANDSRLLEVFLFDYNHGTTLLRVVDIERMDVVSTNVINSVHLPLTDVEIQHARSLLLQHTGLEQVVKTELAELEAVRASGTVGVADLETRTSVWVPGAGNAFGSNCEHQRCALVSLFTEKDYSLSVEPVVNLSSGEVFLDFIQ